MRRRLMVTVAAVALGSLAGCATGPTVFPVQVARYHYDAVADRGTFAIMPPPPGVTASIEYQSYAAAASDELARLGFTPAAPGATPQFLVAVTFNRTEQPLAPRRSPISIGLGGSSYSGGYHSGGGVGGGVSFPIGGGHARTGIVTQLNVSIRRGANAVWEGQSQTLTDAAGADATSGAIAARLAHALFLGFPGESGRTIEVR